MNSPHKGQWRGALLFSLICIWINGWVNNREAGDLRRYRVHYDAIVIVMISQIPRCIIGQIPHSAQFCNRNVNMCTFLLQNGALLDMWLVLCGMCTTGLNSTLKTYAKWTLFNKFKLNFFQHLDIFEDILFALDVFKTSLNVIKTCSKCIEIVPPYWTYDKVIKTYWHGHLCGHYF